MRFWPFRRRCPKDHEDLNAALWEADRALRDAKQLNSRADEIGERLAETRRRNHFAEAVARSMRRA